MIFVVKVQLKKLSARFLQAFLITKKAFLLTTYRLKLKINLISKESFRSSRKFVFLLF